MKQYDAIIIGFGKAGKTLAAELSNRGWQVAVVERSSMMYGRKRSCTKPALPPCSITMTIRNRRTYTNRLSAGKTD